MRLLINLTILTDFVPILYGLRFYRTFSSDLKFVFFFLLFTALVDLVGGITGYNSINNEWLFNLQSPVETIAELYLVLRWFNLINYQMIYSFLSIGYLVYWFSSTVLNSSVMIYNTDEKTIKGLLVILLYGALIVKFILKDTHNVFHDYRFWFAASIFTYYTSTFFFMLTNDYLTSLAQSGMLDLSFINCLAIIAFNVLNTITFKCYLRKRNLFTT